MFSKSNLTPEEKRMRPRFVPVIPIVGVVFAVGVFVFGLLPGVDIPLIYPGLILGMIVAIGALVVCVGLLVNFLSKISPKDSYDEDGRLVVGELRWYDSIHALLAYVYIYSYALMFGRYPD